MRISDFNTEKKVGEVTIHLPDPPNLKDIFGYNLASSSQKYIPNQIPKDLKLWPRQDQVDFLKNLMQRRENGFWFYNNGNIEYITGVHDYYLSWWKLDTGLPKFIDADRDNFYFWRATDKDPDCFGMLYIANRRDGKTHRSNCINYEKVSRTPNSSGGIQSKTGPDAKRVFQKLVQSWKRLPDVLKPTDSGETNPKTELKFEEPGQRGAKGQQKVYKDVLDSYIDYQPAVEEAYDGQKKLFLHIDEYGKTVEVNICDRWDIQKFCLIDEFNGGIIGKALFTSTIEEMEKKGGANAKKMWDDSNPLERNDLKQTKTGLWRYFKPADYGYGRFVNEYGYSDREKSREYILAKRKGLKGTSLYNLIRKEPLTIEEAFVITDKSDVFPSFKIYEQQSFNMANPSTIVRIGNMVWRNESEMQAQFVDDPSGRIRITMDLPEDERNKFEFVKGGIAPSNPKKGCLGVDPFDHRTTAGDRKSDAAAYLFLNYNISRPYHSNCFVLEYIARPDIPEIFYDDMAKICIYYGVQMLCESQKPGVMNYFYGKKMGRYVMQTQVSDYSISDNRKYVDGVATTGQIARDDMVNGFITYIYNYIGQIDPKIQLEMGLSDFDPSLHGNCPFDRLLDDLLKFDISKWTDYDPTVAAMLAYLGAKRLVTLKRKTDTEAPMIIQFPTFKI